MNPLPVESSAAPAPPPDEALLVRVADGDAAALAQLYDRYAALLLGVAERIIGIRREAEDLVHDLFVEAWERAGEYDPRRGSVRTWLLVRTRSRSIDRLRASRIANVVSLDDRLVSGSTAADGDLAADRARVRDALAALSAEQRQVLLLGYFEGLSSSEMATRIGVPLGTVKSRVAAARTQLAILLGAEGRA